MGRRPKEKLEVSDLESEIATGMDQSEQADEGLIEVGQSSMPMMRMIALSQIGVSFRNPRSVPAGLFASDEETEFEGRLRELADSIKSVGLLQPLTVRPKGTSFELIAGERRYQAIKQFLPEMTEVMCIVSDVDDVQAIAKALVENLMRESLAPLDEARGYRYLRDEGQAVKEIAALVGKGAPHVSNMMRLLNLPQGVQTMISDGLLSKSHGISLASIAEHPEDCTRIADQASANRWPQGTLESVLSQFRAKKDQERRDEEAKIAPPLIEPEPNPAQEPGQEAVITGDQLVEPEGQEDESTVEETKLSADSPQSSATPLATAAIPAPETVEPPTVPQKTAPIAPATTVAPAKAPAPPTPPPASKVPENPEVAPTPDMVSVMVRPADYEWMMENRLKIKDLVNLVRSVGSGNLRQFLDVTETLGVEAPVLFEEFLAGLLGKIETKNDTVAEATTEGAE